MDIQGEKKKLLKHGPIVRYVPEIPQQNHDHIISASASKDLEDTTDPYRSSTPKQTTSSLEVEWSNLGSPRKNMVSTWGEIAKFHS